MTWALGGTLPATVLLGQILLAQGATSTVADGVYTDIQANRGAASYDGACGRCHRQDLGGADGPALKDDRFNRTFAGKDLKLLYTRVATTMPRGAPGSLADGVYLDILAHLLRENGFPPGAHELQPDTLAGVEVLPTRPKPLPPVEDFSYVDVVGCFTAASDGTWTLIRGSEPASAAAPGTPGDANRTIAPLGTRTYRMLDAMAYSPESRRGQKTYLRGLLIRLPGEERIAISQIETLSPTCQN